MTFKTRLLGLAALAGALAFLPAPGRAQQPQQAAPDQRQGQVFDAKDGAKIFYQVSGQGQPLVLIHGYPLSGELFKYQRQALGQHFKVITLDLPGFGKSQAPSDQGSIEGYAKDVIGLLDHLGIQKAIIGGHSMGGVITMELYKEDPQRFQGMVLIDTNPKKAPIVGKNIWNGDAEQAQKEGVASTVPLLISNMLTGDTLLHNKALGNELKNVIKEASVNGMVGGGHALANRADYTGMLGSVKVPTLIVVGVDDPLWPFPISQMMHQSIPKSELAMIPGASHASVFEQPQKANQAIEQWATQQVAGGAASGSSARGGGSAMSGSSSGGMSAEQVKQVQSALKAQGLYDGQVDGVVGPETQAALSRYQQKAGLPQTATLDRQTLDSLMGRATSGMGSSSRSGMSASAGAGVGQGSSGTGSSSQHSGSSNR